MAFLNRHSPPNIITLVLVSGLAALSMNVFLPSLTGMAQHFGVDYAVMQLAVSAYLGVSALLQLVIGPISDRFGRRRVLLAVYAVFTLASLGTLLAPSAETFLAARFAQAVIATSFVLSRAAVRDMFPGPEAASMIGYVTMGMALVPMVGPVVGGFLDVTFGWRASFLLLFVLGALTLALVWADLGETLSAGGVPFRDQLAGYPVLLRSHRFWGYSLSAALASAVYFAYLGGAPFVGAQVFGLSPAEVGYFFAVPAGGYVIGNFLSGRFATRLGMDRMVLIGALFATAILALSLAAEAAGLHHPVLFFGTVGLTSIGNGLSLPSANAGLMTVRPELAGTASGLGATLTIGGGAIASSVAGLILGPGTGALPLVVLMAACSAGSVAAVGWVHLRRRRVLGI